MTETEKPGPLPRWDLTEFYHGLDDPQIEKDLELCSKEWDEFAKKYRGKVAELDGDGLADMLTEVNALYAIKGRVSYYAALLEAVEGDKPEVNRLVQRMDELGGWPLFVSLEMNAMPEDELMAKWESSPKLQEYSRYIQELLDEKPYTLSDDKEQVLALLRPVGMNQYVRLYREQRLNLRYPFLGEELTDTEIALQMRDKDPEIRKEALRVYDEVNSANTDIPVFAMNNIIKHKSIVDKMRGYKRPDAARNHSNNIEEEVVDALVDTVCAHGKALEERFDECFARLIGVDTRERWHNEKDIPDVETTKYTFEEARDIVLDAYRKFSPEMADIAQLFFDNGWIDAEPRPGKRSGAFAKPPFQDGHPFTFLNFQGEAKDVMTMAHELGHGVHQYLDARNQNPVVRGTPLTISETASVFGEELVFQSLLEKASTPREKQVLLLRKVREDLGTCVTQIKFTVFEQRIHNARKEGELSREEFSRHWMEAMQGNGRTNPDSWTTVPHLFRTPFYVYAYAFGQLMVNALYEAYQSGKVEDFQQKYLDALGAGGTKHHSELLKPFGLDAREPDFWEKGLERITKNLERLEALLDQDPSIRPARTKTGEAAPEAEREAAAPANDNDPVQVLQIEAMGVDRSVSRNSQRGRG